MRGRRARSHRKLAARPGSKTVVSKTLTCSEPVMEDTTLDRYIVDYLLRTGRRASAKALAEKRGIEVGPLSYLG